MEQFVRFIVAGGVTLVAGLWLLAALDTDTTVWLLGPLLVVVGAAGLLYGVAEPLEYWAG